MALQEEMDARIPLEALEVEACSAEGGSEGDCQLHLLQLRAQGLTAGVNSTDGASVEAEDLAVQEWSAQESLHPTASGVHRSGVEAEDLHKSSASGVQNVSADVAGACTAQDHARFSSMGAGYAAGTFPHKIASCADKALKWFTMHRDVMTRCVSQSLGVSMSCASCYSYIGQYGYNHCKTKCVFGKWCGHGCLTCTKRSYPVVDKCAGFQAPLPSFC